MIKFFRNIRKNLLNEGKTTKYLKYAIGEIVLVVIGILIALSINNWNQDRQQRQKEKKMLIELKRDLISNDSVLQHEIEFQLNTVEEATVAIEHIKNKKPFNDTIGSYLNHVSWIERIQFASSAYESLKSLGIDLISSDHLRAEITHIFGNEFPSKTMWLGDSGMIHAQLLLPIHQKIFEAITPGNSTQNVQLIPENDSLLQSQEFINALSRKKAFKMVISESLLKLQNAVKKSINDIDKELETFNQ